MSFESTSAIAAMRKSAVDGLQTSGGRDSMNRHLSLWAFNVIAKDFRLVH